METFWRDVNFTLMEVDDSLSCCLLSVRVVKRGRPADFIGGGCLYIIKIF